MLTWKMVIFWKHTILKAEYKLSLRYISPFDILEKTSLVDRRSSYIYKFDE
jgi:hypothetical protein